LDEVIWQEVITPAAVAAATTAAMHLSGQVMFVHCS